MAPAFLRRVTTLASSEGMAPVKAAEPALVWRGGSVAMLSFTRKGIPWRGERIWPLPRSESSSMACSRAEGLVSITALRRGLRREILRR